MKDEAIGEIRNLRHHISEEFDHDPQKYIEFLKSQSYKYIRQIELFRKLSDEGQIFTGEPERQAA